MKKRYILKHPITILSGVMIGALIGVFNTPISNFLRIDNFAQVISFPGQLYLFYLQMTVIPIVITAISSSMGKLMRDQNGAKLIKKIAAVFVIGMIVCALIGMGIGFFGKPGSGLSEDTRSLLSELITNSDKEGSGALEINLDSKQETASPDQGPSIAGFFKNLIPSNIFNAFSIGSTMSIVFFSIIFGLAIGFLPESSALMLIDLLSAIFLAFQKLISWSLYLLPFGLICLLAGQIAEVGIQIFLAMSKFIILYCACSVIIFVICTFVIWIQARNNGFIKTLSMVFEPILLAFATRNSMAALPSSIKCLAEKMKFDSTGVNLTLPLGMIMGRFGNILYFAVGVFFIAQIYNTSLESIHYAIIFIGVIFAGIATTGASGLVTLSMMSIVLDPLNLPLEAVLIIFMAIDSIIEPFRTFLNVYVNMAVTATIVKNTSSSFMMKIKKISKFAKLSVAALLLSTSIAAAQDAPASAAETVPVAAEPVPAAKPAESLSTTIAGTKISLYGRLELNAAYEDGNTTALWSSSAPKEVKDADGKVINPQGRTSLSVARTRFGMNLEGPSKEDEPTLKGRFEADFARTSDFNNFNGSVGFRLRQSWGSVTFKDIGLTLLFGQTDDVVNPIDPPSINPSSLNGAGNIGNRRPQIRLTETIGPVEIAVAATHDRTYGYTPQTDKKDTTTAAAAAVSDNNPPSFPAFQGRLGLKLPAFWAGEKANLGLGIGGLYGKNEVANSDDKNRYARPEPSYMFGADLSLPIIDILTLTGEFFSGQNLSRYEGSLGQSRAYHDDGGIKSIGWWGGLAVKLPASVSANAGIGAESLDDKSKRDTRAENNMFIFGNVAYNFTSAAKVTFEYLTFSTDYSVANKDDSKKFDKSDSGSLNRFELNFRYDFK